MGRTVWILGDQLTTDGSALAAADPATDRILLVESAARCRRERYHRQKLALVLAAMRHLAAGLREQGYEVDEVRLGQEQGLGEAVRAHVRRHRSTGVVVMEPNDWPGARNVERLAAGLPVPVEVTPTTMFLCPRDEFRAWAAGRERLRMHDHYVRMRRELGLLVDVHGEPAGGRWSFDPDNRETHAAWRRSGLAAARPGPPERAPDPLVDEVAREVDARFADHPGRAADLWLPVRRDEALAWLDHFVRERLPWFGPFEDTMDRASDFLFHSTLSPALNLGLLHASECVAAAVAALERGEAPLASVEGFVRQLVGWREFVNGVYWLRMPGYRDENALDARRPLPRAVATGETDMACVSNVLDKLERRGWTHHIERLMALGNLFLLAGVEPHAATRFYLERYVDAYDWVMWPNTVGMVLHADGGFMATKPYAAGGAYIARMSDHCRSCRYDPRRRTGDDACPFSTLYWDFVARHRTRLAANPRTRNAVLGWERLGAEEQQAVRARALELLAPGGVVGPERG